MTREDELKKLCEGTGYTIREQQLSEPGKPCSARRSYLLKECLG
jgi:hypothetical protein